MNKQRPGWSGAFGVLLLCHLFPSLSYGQAPFFQGKTITIVQGRDPGGTGDLRVRASCPVPAKIYSRQSDDYHGIHAWRRQPQGGQSCIPLVRPDGLTIGNFSSGMVSLAILGESGVLYDIDKFHYLGSPYSTYHSMFVTRKDAGLDTLEKLRAATGAQDRRPVPRFLHLQ